MGYRVVFDSRANLPSGMGFLWGVVFWLVMAVGFYVYRRTGGRKWKDWVVVGWLMVVGLGMLIEGVRFRLERRDCMEVAGGLRGEVVEGVVSDLVPMPPEGHAAESFRVDGTGFQFSQFEGGCAFHQTLAFGSPLRPGQRVRIRHLDGKIMRIEVAEVR